MATKKKSGRTYTITVEDLAITVVQKKIKHLHLAVYPPDGRVRLSAPVRASDEDIRQLLEARLGWIRRQQERIASMQPPPARQYDAGEVQTFWGEGYVLELVVNAGKPRVVLNGGSRLELHVRPGSTAADRERVLSAWYRQQLQEALPALLAKWEPALGVKAREVRIRRMKTRWGSCSISRGRIWLNLELVHKPPRLLEYVIVHELAHLLVPGHNARFKAVLDRHLPGWRELRGELNRN